MGGGRLGNGRTEEGECAMAPCFEFPSPTLVVKISCGSNFSAVLTSAGDLSPPPSSFDPPPPQPYVRLQPQGSSWLR